MSFNMGDLYLALPTLNFQSSLKAKCVGCSAGSGFGARAWQLFDIICINFHIIEFRVKQRAGCLRAEKNITIILASDMSGSILIFILLTVLFIPLSYPSSYIVRR